MLNPIQHSGEGGGEGVWHEIRVIKVRKEKASEYVKAYCDNLIFKTRKY